MCEINPKHSHFFRLELWTSQPLTKEEWRDLVYETVLKMEEELNKAGKVRVHIHETDE